MPCINTNIDYSVLNNPIFDAGMFPLPSALSGLPLPRPRAQTSFLTRAVDVLRAHAGVEATVTEVIVFAAALTQVRVFVCVCACVPFSIIL